MNSKKHKSFTSSLGVRMTATVSVALVLLILGILVVMGITAHQVVKTMRESTGFILVMTDDATPAQIEDLKKRFDSAPYVSSAEFSTPAEVLARWTEMLGDDEDPMELAGENPFGPEFEVKVTSEYASPDSLRRIADPLGSLPGVQEVTVQSEMARSVHSATGDIALVLVVVAAAMLLISVVLINNTVRLSMYSQRFTIHTMRLVGATDSFIRWPFVRRHILSGAIAGLVAALLVWGMLGYLAKLEPAVSSIASPVVVVSIGVGLVVLGVAICSFTSFMATRRYLRMDYDRLFK